MNEERDSQLSAMFDGELPGAECELLARRLSRDEALRSQWSRYSMIGAALRSERGVALHDRVAWRVQSQVAQDVTYGDGTDIGATSMRTTALLPADSQRSAAARRWLRVARPAAGVGIAAGVAAMSILWLRTQEVETSLLAGSPASAAAVFAPDSGGSIAGTTLALDTGPSDAARPISNGEPERYSTPAPSSQTSIAPSARLANYVVAHSEYSGPLTRRMALLGIVGTDSVDDAQAAEDASANTDPNDAP